MHRVSVLCSGALFMAAMILGNTALWAAAPSSPEQLSGRLISSSSNQSNAIQLTWFQSDPDEADEFVIYIHRGESTDPNVFEKFSSVAVLADTTGSDTLVGRNGFFSYTITISESLEHSFYVTAGNADGESDPSNIIFMEYQIRNSVWFTSAPVENAYNGELYSYQAYAEAADGSTITYELLRAPQGMTVNSATGLVEWTAVRSANALVRLRATSEDGYVAVQEWIIAVRWCELPATISGNLVDQYGDPVNKGLILAYPADYDANEPQDSNYLGKFPLRSEVRNGSYTIALLDQGEYALQFISQTYINEWYEDAADRAHARIINLDCDHDLRTDWVVERLPAPRSFTVSGQATWSTDGNGIPNVRVDFIVQSTNNGNRADSTDSLGFWRVFSTYTDDNGQYSLEVLDSYVYIARAISADRTSGTPDGPQFVTQYYDGVTDASEADAIKLDGDRDGINFVVDPRPVYANSISGIVQDEMDDGVAAFVIAYKVSEDPRIEYVARTTTTDNTYSYELENLTPGEYIVYAIPQNRLHFPGYYREGDLAVPSWMAATRIDVGETDDVEDITVILGDRIGRIGNCIVDGSVRGNRSSIKSVDGGDKAQGDDEQAIDGALVYIVDQAGVVVDYRLSDDQGAYSIDGIEQGVYTLVVDKIGFEPFEQVIEFEFDGAEINVEAPLAEAQVVSVDEPVPGAALNALAFPNPAAASVALKFEAQAGTARISVINSAGVEALNAITATSEGVNVYRMHTSNLAAGMYIVRIESGVLTSEVSVRVVR